MDGWRSAWPDALAFAVGLGAAWWAGWTTADLVWSLWLSSLVVGYATIVWSIVRPGAELVLAARRRGGSVARALASTPAAAAIVGLILLLGALALLAFFTVHFGMFHFVHSQFLASFFPVDPGEPGRGMVGMSTYLEVARRYWWFLPAAFLAERASFRRAPERPERDVSVTAAAVAARKARQAAQADGMLAPYRNVMRMHVLIFFFAFAHFARLDNFAVYAVVYAVYFFPWRLARRSVRAADPVPAPSER